MGKTEIVELVLCFILYSLFKSHFNSESVVDQS